MKPEYHVTRLFWPSTEATAGPTHGELNDIGNKLTNFASQGWRLIAVDQGIAYLLREHSQERT